MPQHAAVQDTRSPGRTDDAGEDAALTIHHDPDEEVSGLTIHHDDEDSAGDQAAQEGPGMVVFHDYDELRPGNLAAVAADSDAAHSGSTSVSSSSSSSDPSASKALSFNKRLAAVNAVIHRVRLLNPHSNDLAFVEDSLRRAIADAKAKTGADLNTYVPFDLVRNLEREATQWEHYRACTVPSYAGPDGLAGVWQKIFPLTTLPVEDNGIGTKGDPTMANFIPVLGEAVTGIRDWALSGAARSLVHKLPVPPANLSAYFLAGGCGQKTLNLMMDCLSQLHN